MKYCFITGSSKGLGHALALALLERNDWKVFGIARSCTIEHERYTHVKLDLSDLSETDKFNFPSLENAEEIVLINNAGILGSVARAGNYNTADIVKAINVNFSSLAILCNKFIEIYRSLNVPKTIINISSGAGKSAIDGWSIYCASKAAVDHFSRVLAQEQNVKNEGFKIVSLAPGIVDTEMQSQIRSAKEEEFSRIQDFLRYKERGELSDPLFVARKIIFILDKPGNFNETVFSVRDY